MRLLEGLSLANTTSRFEKACVLECVRLLETGASGQIAAKARDEWP
jgi:hypothetical protein